MLLCPNLTRGTRKAPFAKIKAAFLHLQCTKEKLTQTKESTSSLKSNSGCVKVLEMSVTSEVDSNVYLVLISLLYSNKIRKTEKDYIYIIYNAFLLLGMIHMNVMCEL